MNRLKGIVLGALLVTSASVATVMVASCGEEAQGFCAKTCTQSSDCCPTGEPDCPGKYPENFVCTDGLCRKPLCEKDSDCAVESFGGLTLGCRNLNGLPSCAVVCETDGDCKTTAGIGTYFATCSGTDDDGRKICSGSLPACTKDSDCLGAGSHCEDGKCGCLADSDCPANRHCQGRVCGCESGTECGPSLDACTTDPAFAYPPSATAAGSVTTSTSTGGS